MTIKFSARNTSKPIIYILIKNNIERNINNLLLAVVEGIG